MQRISSNVGWYMTDFGGEKSVPKKKQKKKSNPLTLQFLRPRIPYLTIHVYMVCLSFTRWEIFVAFRIFGVRAVDIEKIWKNWWWEKCPCQRLSYICVYFHDFSSFFEENKNEFFSNLFYSKFFCSTIFLYKKILEKKSQGQNLIIFPAQYAHI